MPITSTNQRSFAMSAATPVRDPSTDALLTPDNAVIALIDYQPEQYAGVASIGHGELLANVTMLGRWIPGKTRSFELRSNARAARSSSSQDSGPRSASPCRPLDALREGYEVFVVVDAIGDVCRVGHDCAMQGMVQAGATPISVFGPACELQRDWGRPGAERLRAVMREHFAKHKALKGWRCSASRRDVTLSPLPLRPSGQPRASLRVVRGESACR